MALQTIPGAAFAPQLQGAYTILFDQVTPSISGVNVAKTTGITRISPLQLQSSIPGKWRLIGWSLNLKVAIERGLNPVGFGFADASVWATFGSLIAGLSTNAGLAEAAYPVLPNDFTTFEEVWTPNDDNLVVAGRNPDNIGYQTIGRTLSFPSPIPVSQVDQLQFALIMTPSILGCISPASIIEFGPIVGSASYSLLFDDGT